MTITQFPHSSPHFSLGRFTQFMLRGVAVSIRQSQRVQFQNASKRSTIKSCIPPKLSLVGISSAWFSVFGSGINSEVYQLVIGGENHRKEATMDEEVELGFGCLESQSPKRPSPLISNIQNDQQARSFLKFPVPISPDLDLNGGQSENGRINSNRSPNHERYLKWAPDQQGVTLTWSDLNVFSTTPATGWLTGSPQCKRIIQDVSGAVKPGTLTALMGASGAGKSTLMAALAYRNSAGFIVNGEIRVNGQLTGNYMHHLSGFLHQEDLFTDELTVREHLHLMCLLRLDRGTSSRERRHRVDRILQRLVLTGAQDRRIGRGLSGGERKRLAFATELLTEPPLLFCDEPTTGLDSFQALALVRLMRTLTSRGTTIMCTIHQPSSDLLGMFDQLLLMADGRIAFLGDPDDALVFFKRHGYSCPASYNPADFFIHTLATTPGAEAASRAAVRRLCDQFAVSDQARHIQLIIDFERHVGSSCEEVLKGKKITFADIKRLWWPQRLALLTRRSFLQILRNPSLQALRIFQKVAIALMAGLCFVGTDLNSQTGVVASKGALFLLVAENTFTPMYSVLALFPTELPLFMREYKAGLYGPITFYFSKVLAMLPGLILEPFLFAVVIYFLAGLRESTSIFLITTAVAVLTMNVSIACGFCFSAAFESVPAAMAFLVPFDYILMITSGVFVKLNTLPFFISWAKYLSWIMYSNEAMTIAQWSDVPSISCPNSTLPCIHDGQEVLSSYDFSASHFIPDVIVRISSLTYWSSMTFSWSDWFYLGNTRKTSTSL